MKNLVQLHCCLMLKNNTVCIKMPIQTTIMNDISASQRVTVTFIVKTGGNSG